MTDRLLSPDELEAALRAIGAERYHNLHPFHRALHGGNLNKGQVQAWALNRYYYQASIPAKDATLLARLPTAELRREWRRRLIDHDGTEPGTGGVARWLKLTDGLGLDRAYVESLDGLLPGTRFAVEAYVHFVRDRSILEAIASSLTELFSPTIISERVSGMLRNYSFITEETLAYFAPRLTQAPQDSAFALAYVKEHARTVEQQQAVLNALKFKCGVLWSMLDELDYAYVSPGNIPPGAFRPQAEA
ncbi:pyrroloquinoline-quinone synthase PqqC [Acetobacter indonesiensis]|uniref:Pyrroloquinoline-quinone synthase n=1 Tax=Acetobacter indonesiensis TaxID=104101 RepID=A0A252ANP6_9PROT|nr:pyrroloquinoline-quinone synthase PqqC [Acetobacter indonesiensis]OUI91505.1 pyrroloquinoline quinone biosynthesis protein PqqC [Acetobacter indonesiensis]